MKFLKCILTVLQIVCIVLAVICIIAGIIVQFKPVPGEHSRFSIEWVYLYHYWYLWLGFIAGVAGAYGTQALKDKMPE